MKRLVVVGLAAFAVCLAAQTVAQPPQRITLHAGRVLDVKSGKMLSDQTLIIENGRVVSSGPSAEARIPWSNPETWVTECTGHMGNTFGPNGFSSGSKTLVSKSK